MSKRDRKNGVPTSATSIPLVDPHAMPPNPSIGDLVKDATAQVSTLVRAEVELAKAEITRDVKKGLTGSIFFILALVVLLYSTFFMFFFLAELLDTWLWRWAAFLIVFILMLVVTAIFALLGYLKVRRIRGPQQTIESVKETTAALTPGLAKFAGGASSTPTAAQAPVATPERPAVTSAAPAVVTTTAAGRSADDYPDPRVDYESAPQTGYVDAEQTQYGEQNPQPVEYTQSVEYTQPVEYAGEAVVEYTEPAVEYTEDSGYTSYSEYSSSSEYTGYAPDTGYVEYTEATGYPPGHDPTAAVYADTGLPVTPQSDRSTGDSSGW